MTYMKKDILKGEEGLGVSYQGSSTSFVFRNKANPRDLISANSFVISNGIRIDFSAHVTLKVDR